MMGQEEEQGYLREVSPLRFQKSNTQPPAMKPDPPIVPLDPEDEPEYSGEPQCWPCYGESAAYCPDHFEGAELKTKDGVKIVKGTFTILHKGWEMDNKGWLTTDGQVYTTSHGLTPQQMSYDEIHKHIDETKHIPAGIGFRPGPLLEKLTTRRNVLRETVNITRRSRTIREGINGLVINSIIPTELEPTEDQYCKNTAEFCFNSAAHSLRRGDKAMAEQWLGAAQFCVLRMETDGAKLPPRQRHTARA